MADYMKEHEDHRRAGAAGRSWAGSSSDPGWVKGNKEFQDKSPPYDGGSSGLSTITPDNKPVPSQPMKPLGWAICVGGPLLVIWMFSPGNFISDKYTEPFGKAAEVVFGSGKLLSRNFVVTDPLGGEMRNMKGEVTGEIEKGDIVEVVCWLNVDNERKYFITKKTPQETSQGISYVAGQSGIIDAERSFLGMTNLFEADYHVDRRFGKGVELRKTWYCNRKDFPQLKGLIPE